MKYSGMMMSSMKKILLVMMCILSSSFFQAHHSHELETELCDLNFINEKEREAAHSEFISVNETGSDWIQNNSKKLSKTERSRLKRQANSGGRVKTIETAIFVDHHLKSRFEGRMQDLKRLVLATMNEVQLIYNYKSMKIPIRIVINKFEILQNPDEGPNNAGGDIDKYLDNFCSWQARKYRATNQSSRWDHSLLLTGLDLYKESGGKKNKKVLGLAWVNGMCKPSYSCTLNEGKSFEAAFVIAHEMAHSLGILHDGRGNNCDPEKFIMSEKTGPGKVNWSPCSNKYLENFLSRGNGRCLDNNVIASSDLDFQRVNRLPGEQYTPDIQCQLALGSQYKAYHSTKEPFNDVCRELWCLSGSWATPAHPALEGSSCGNRGQKCFQGTCTSQDQQISGTKRRSVPSNQVPVSGTNRNPNNNQNNNQYNQMRRPGGIRFGPFGPFIPGRKRGRSEDDSSAIPIEPNERKETPPPAEASGLTSTSETEKPFLYHLKGLVKTIIPQANSFFNLFSFHS